MALQDVTHVIFDRDPACGPFNEAAALEAYHLVAKMDDETASEFVYHVVNEVLETTIVKNRDLVQKHLDRTIAKTLVNADLDKLAEGLDAEQRQEVRKHLLGVVSKDNSKNFSDAQLNAWKHRNKGRFSSFDHPTVPIREGRLSGDAAQALANGPHAIKIQKRPDWDQMDQDEKAAYRAQYLEVARHLEPMGGFDGNNDVHLHYKNGTKASILSAHPSSIAEAIAPHDGKTVEAMSVTSYKPTVGGQIANLPATLGAHGVGGLQAMNSEVERQWYNSDALNPSDQMYNRIAAGSKVLNAASLGSPKLKLAAQFGTLVGEHGASAESVFGPPTRRLAYRYRGTEKRPSKELVDAYGQAVHQSKMETDADLAANGRRSLAHEAGHRAGQDTATRAPTSDEREEGRKAIIAYLMDPKRAPKAGLGNLQLAAGHTPPSQGVLLNKDGQIVTQAVGYGDDWYLPFNLKNLGAAKGGEYIRTRSTGGLTSEDIYTGLMSGASRVTVASRSGVFSIDFDQDLRGGRRHNDKAMRMARRYDELLDAVQSGEVPRKSLDPETKQMIRARVAELYPEGAISREERAKFETAVTNDFMSNPEWSENDQRLLETDPRLLVRTGASVEERRHVESLARARKADLLDQKEYFFQLNGRGYQAAQDALQEQFPYYIESRKHVPLDDTDDQGRRDKGYVEPGALRPTEARATLHGVKGHTTMGFQSARRAGRAVPIIDRHAGKPGNEGGVTAGDRAPEPKSPSGAPKSSSLVERYEKEQGLRSAAEQAHRGLESWVSEVDPRTPSGKAVTDYHAMDRDQFASLMTKPGEAEKFMDSAETAAAPLTNEGGVPFVYPGKQALEAAVGPRSKGAYSPEAAYMHPRALFDTGADPEEKSRAAQSPLILSASTMGDAEEGQIIREAEMTAVLANTLKENPRDVRDLLKAQGFSIDSDHISADRLSDLIGNPERIQRHMRLLKVEQEAKKPRTDAEFKSITSGLQSNPIIS